jgi:hypothetical protein
MSTASDLLPLYIAAEQAILQGQSVRLGDRQVSFADLSYVQTERAKLERRVADEQAAAAGRSGLGYSVARLD